jgi:two-component system response regulator MprA
VHAPRHCVAARPKSSVGVPCSRLPPGHNGLMKILVVDDDRAVRDALRRALTLGGYDVHTADGGRDGLQKAADLVPDAIVLDVAMPDIDGLEACRRLREGGNRVPVLMLTARDAVSDRIDGLDAGADDYLVKPFDVGELKARLRALLRRTGAEGDPDALTFAELRLDSGRHGVAVGDGFAELTRTEYQLLELLMLNPRRVLPHTLIYDRVWGYDFGPASNALRVYVGYLRRKLEQAGARPLIHTVRGVGYALREP